LAVVRETQAPALLPRYKVSCVQTAHVRSVPEVLCLSETPKDKIPQSLVTGSKLSVAGQRKAGGVRPWRTMWTGLPCFANLGT
jgi:hypothetical protein